MRVLFDQGTPAPLRNVLQGHQVETAFELGWQALHNGELLDRAEKAEFDAIITTDQNLRYQQNLAGRRLAILVLRTTDWRRIRRSSDVVLRAVELLAPGAYWEVDVPT